MGGGYLYCGSSASRYTEEPFIHYSRHRGRETVVGLSVARVDVPQ